MIDSTFDAAAAERELDNALGYDEYDDPTSEDQDYDGEEEDYSTDEEEIEEKEDYSTDEEDEDSPEEDEEEIEEEEDDDALPHENHAAKRAKEEGRRRKELERKTQILEESHLKLQQELEGARRQLEKYEATEINPLSHPGFLSLKGQLAENIINDIATLVGFEEAEIFENNWGEEWLDACETVGKPLAEKRQIAENLRLHIGKKLGLLHKDATEFDEYHDSAAKEKSQAILSVLLRHTGKHKELHDLYQNIGTKAKGKALEVGYKEYAENTKAARQNLLSIASMSEEEIAEDPSSIQALAARKIASSPEAKKNYNLITKTLLEAAYGPESLSQEALDHYVQRGQDMAEFHKSREARVKHFRENELPKLAAMMTLWPEIRAALPSYLRREHEKTRQNDQRAVLRKATVSSKMHRRSSAKEDHLHALDELFGEEDD